jgi:disulfide oxidoreductase YuzD
MKIDSLDTYTTTVFQIIDENDHNYVVTHREDGDEYFIPVWIIEDEYGDTVHGDIRVKLIELVNNYFSNKNK